MIERYYRPTPNGHKVALLLEEAGRPYEIKPVNIGRGELFVRAFLCDLAEQPHAGHRRHRAGGWR